MTLIRWETDSSRRSFFCWRKGLSVAAVLAACVGMAAYSATLDQEVSQREASGDLAGARTLLEEQAKEPGNAVAAAELAVFLYRHEMPDRREAFLKWASEESDASRKKMALREAVLIDFMAGRDADLAADLGTYRSAGGTDLSQPERRPATQSIYGSVTIPGPLSSFARMAALSPDLPAEDLLPALARNVVTNGFQAVTANESLEPTEYLRLLVRYISQARELEAMAGKDHKIVISSCDSEQTGDLLKIIGYRMRGACGSDIVLETVNATRAFLTVDSGFPLTQLEQDLRANRKFELPFAPTVIPVLYNADYWMGALSKDTKTNFLDAFLSDPSLCRLYLGLSRLDRPTADALRKQANAVKLKIYAHVLDFFGSMFQVRNGVAVVPGSAKVWASLVGVSPNNGGAFYEKILTVDDGWLASYYDALSRLGGPTAAYLYQPERTKRFYEALRGKITTPGPARPVFRSSTDLLLLTNSLRIEANGRPHVPGDIDAWRTLFMKHPHGKYDGKLTRSAASWRDNDDVLEALFALCRKSVENEPLKMFLALNDVDRARAKPMSPQLASRLIAMYRTYGAQYALFADSPDLSEASINHYLDLFVSTNGIHDTLLRADTVGTLQALTGLWQILCRQNSIRAADQDASFSKLIEPFEKVKSEQELFDVARSGVDTLIAAAGVQTPTRRQDALQDLLVGKIPNNPDRTSPGASPAEQFVRVFDAQRLIPIDDLFSVAEHSSGSSADAKAIAGIQSQLSRFQESETLRSGLSSEERSMLSLGYWSERHVDQERKLNLEAMQKNADKKDVRAVLAPFLRDSLVGILYSYYAPPGAQLLLTNPLFVRTHDFIGTQGLPMEWRPTEITGSGWPASAGGRLMGSLCSLPYALAEAEQNFLTPKREQALIWGDLVPQILVDATISRWRDVDPVQLRWISLHLQRGRNLLASAALDRKLEPEVLAALARREVPARVEWVDDRLRSGRFAEAISQVTPAVLYTLATDPALKDLDPDVASYEIVGMAGKDGPEVAPAAIAARFGTPKPTLLHSYRPGLLELRMFPALMGYSSRILAESWESDNLYFAALADEAGVPTANLDSLVPEWTRATVENIFATHLEDWPALLRSLYMVGDTVRQKGTLRAAITSSVEN
ncbi:MAG TPA: hypothetical protein VG168_07455 [Bryobacteraceae bacterium]|nr:hypothetical protein [Bryobacteraceae bacterium]